MQRIVPYLSYEDAATALDWLFGPFGFTERLRYVDEDGSVTHAELELGGASVFLGSPGAGYRNPRRSGDLHQVVHVQVDDVEEHYGRARSAGAIVISPPEDTPYGVRRYRAEDPEGHRWIFAQRVREVAPQDWGAITPSDRS